jgi:hypothetical protein
MLAVLHELDDSCISDVLNAFKLSDYQLPQKTASLRYHNEANIRSSSRGQHLETSRQS